MNPLTQWGQWDLNPAGKWVQLQSTGEDKEFLIFNTNDFMLMPS
jgi:hypothetical protein